jgi:hypothetical protein
MLSTEFQSVIFNLFSNYEILDCMQRYIPLVDHLYYVLLQ